MVARSLFFVGRISRNDILALAAVAIGVPLATWSLPFQGSDPLGVALVAVAAAAGVVAGWAIGELQFRQTRPILEAIVGAQLDLVQWSSPTAVDATLSFLDSAPPYLRRIVETIALTFNSPWMSLGLGMGRSSFLGKSPSARRTYLDKWAGDANLQYGLELLKVVLALGVYDDPEIWKRIGYCGPVVPSNSPGGPDVFCPYDAEDAASRGVRGDARFACKEAP